MDVQELIAALAAGIAGVILSLIEKQFPTSGIGRV
jgi:hypothetical protein